MVEDSEIGSGGAGDGGEGEERRCSEARDRGGGVRGKDEEQNAFSPDKGSDVDAKRVPLETPSSDSSPLFDEEDPARLKTSKVNKRRTGTPCATWLTLLGGRRERGRKGIKKTEG